MAETVTPIDADGASAPIALRDPSLYINRELSMLEFHRRVLDQARDPSVPLLERLRFLTISSSILDEFFEIRVAGLEEQIALGLARVGPDGMTPQETLAHIRGVVVDLVEDQYKLLNDVILPSLAVDGIVLYRRDAWNRPQQDWIREYFEREVQPVLTPIGLDPAHPFPRVVNKSLNFIVSLDGKDAYGRRSRTAVVQAPRVLPRVIRLPAEICDVPDGFVLLSSVIHAHVGELFPGMRPTACHQFRVTRNSDLWIDEEETVDLMRALKGELPRRHFGRAVRLELTQAVPAEIREFLCKQFELGAHDVYEVDGPVNLHRLEALVEQVDRPALKYTPFIPGLPRKAHNTSPSVFDTLRDRDVLLHHPYQSFAPVMELVEQAAADPDVLAIKQTVYRTGADSPMSQALVKAAEAGKEVTAVIELRARFDEAANIDLASKLQEAGAKVVYGVVGFKAHAKMLLVVRRERDGLRRYVHLGTGNYNPKTARMYTDVGYMTSDRRIGEDVHALFQQLTGFGRAEQLHSLVQTPFRLHERLIELIRAEEKAARSGKPAHIMAKMNALIEPRIIQALYQASQAGVDIDLIVRGICCLRPGIPGVSETIRVRSLVGRFLEHHRVFYFHAGGDEVVLCSSADWMPRNFFRRVEVAFPIEKRKLRQRVVSEVLRYPVEDNCQAWEMDADGQYARLQPKEGEPRICAQEDLLGALSQARR